MGDGQQVVALRPVLTDLDEVVQQLGRPFQGDPGRGLQLGRAFVHELNGTDSLVIVAGRVVTGGDEGAQRIGRTGFEGGLAVLLTPGPASFISWTTLTR